MDRHKRDPHKGDCLSPTDPDLLEVPLEFIYEDHLREREICALLDKIAGPGQPNRDEVSRVLTFLGEELPRHLEDEEQDLFPLLLRRCEPEDEIGKVIARLSADHRHAGKDTPDVIVILKEIEAGETHLSDDQRTILIGYASHARHHLILENAIILPFARLRLAENDLVTLSQRMQQRRGIGRLSTHPDSD